LISRLDPPSLKIWLLLSLRGTRARILCDGCLAFFRMIVGGTRPLVVPSPPRRSFVGIFPPPAWSAQRLVTVPFYFFLRVLGPLRLAGKVFSRFLIFLPRLRFFKLLRTGPFLDDGLLFSQNPLLGARGLVFIRDRTPFAYC